MDPLSVKLDNCRLTDTGSSGTAKSHKSDEDPSVGSSEKDTGQLPTYTEMPMQLSSRASYAHILQKECLIALKAIKESQMISNSNGNHWADPLAMAPQAVITMAILLKAADQKVATGLEIEEVIIKDDKGVEKVGELPSKFFHTNLQHCSDIGYGAFDVAEKEMTMISSIARSMIDESGTLGYIIELIEDPEDAKMNVESELTHVKKNAEKCLEAIKKITDKFYYWHMNISHLMKNTFSKKDQVVKEREDAIKGRGVATVKKGCYTKEEEILTNRITELRKDFERAEKSASLAKEKYDKLLNEPEIQEPSHWEESEKVKQAIPDTKPPAISRGILTHFKDWSFGQSDEHAQEDMKIRKEHIESIRKDRVEAIEKARKQRDIQRKDAAESLRAAREEEEHLRVKWQEALTLLGNSNTKLAEAKENISRASSDIELLVKKDISLNEIMDILKRSVKHLTQLKEQILPLKDFFTSILGEIRHNTDQDLRKFLTPIENGIKKSRNNEEAEIIKLSTQSKKRIISTALRMQGRFSTIADIANAYITVSKLYIRPAIIKMEGLATAEDSEWDAKRLEFQGWCNNAAEKINAIAVETDKHVDVNMMRNMGILQQLAIEAAA